MVQSPEAESKAKSTFFTLYKYGVVSLLGGNGDKSVFSQ